jgi:hypothetical protein
LRVPNNANHGFAQNNSFDLHFSPEQGPEFDVDLKMGRAHEIIGGICRIVTHGEICEPHAQTGKNGRLHLAQGNFTPECLLRLVNQIALVACDESK